MRRGKSPLRFVYMFVFLGMLWTSSGAIHAAEYEIPGDRKASEILPAEILKGPHYRIREVVIADFDLPFGTAGLDFNQDPLQGIADALAAEGRELGEATLAEMDAAWEAAKAGERESVFG